MKKWYHDATTNYFCGIHELEEKDNFSYTQGMKYAHGPFDSFEEAKADALEYFRVDMLLAKEMMAEVSKAKIPRG